MKKFFGIVLWSLILIGCSSDNSDDTPDGENLSPTDPNFERADLLINLADNLIIPAYQGFSSELNDLNTAFETFETTTDEASLVAFRDAFRDAYLVWQRVSIYENGPAESILYRVNINTFPTDEVVIEQNVVLGDADLGSFLNRDAKGLPALDYLLNGSADSDMAILTRYNDPDEGASLFAYTDALIQDMIALTGDVLGEWTGGFRDDFVANDGSSINASVDRIVNDYVFWYEFPVRNGKVRLPSGALGNTPEASILEAFYDGTITEELAVEALQAAQDFFNGVSFSGVNGIGLDDYLNALDAVNEEGIFLSDLINDQFDTAITSIENISSFQEEIQNTPPFGLLEIVDELNRIIPLIKTDAQSFLNISTDFQDNDGD